MVRYLADIIGAETLSNSAVVIGSSGATILFAPSTCNALFFPSLTFLLLNSVPAISGFFN
ncbi:MAG: hypothetical protein IPO24_02075 [Bacteroidetes bacterium]|nr:hypothetical protein [Bacteroidota bacterium]